MAEPWALEAVRVYAVVTRGFTDTEERFVTVPTPWLIESVVALEVVQERTEVAPDDEVLEGVAEKDEIVGAGGASVVKVKSGDEVTLFEAS